MLVSTPLLQDWLGDDAAKRHRREIHFPTGRFGEAIEQAQAVLFLASDESSFVNGTDFVVDGGMTKVSIPLHQTMSGTVEFLTLDRPMSRPKGLRLMRQRIWPLRPALSTRPRAYQRYHHGSSSKDARVLGVYFLVLAFFQFHFYFHLYHQACCYSLDSVIDHYNRSKYTIETKS